MKQGWDKHTLSQLCEVFADVDWIESKDQSNQGIRLIQTGNIGEGYFKDRCEKARFISEETFKRLRCTEIFESDCLISRLPEPVGRSCILPTTKERMITAVDCTIIRFREKLILTKFFNYYSQSNRYLTDVEREATGTTRKRISRNRLGEIFIPLPPLVEQDRIVSILDESFAAIAKAKENAEKNLANAREVFESVFQSVFTNLGEEWEERRLEECFKLKSGEGLTSNMMNNNGVYPVFGGNGIAGVHDNFNLSGSNIIIGRVGALCGNVRHVNEKIWLTDNAFKVVDFQYDFDNAFLTYLLNFKNLRSFARQAAQPVISNSSLKDIYLQFPKEKSEQQSIVSNLDSLSTETRKLETIYKQKLADLEELKKSILEKAFNGELNTN